jgi:signal transduction histidine kinase
MQWRKTKIPFGGFFKDLDINGLREVMFVMTSIAAVSILVGFGLPAFGEFQLARLSIEVIISATILANLFLSGRIYKVYVGNAIIIALLATLLLLLYYEGVSRYFDGATAHIGIFWLVILPIPTLLLLGKNVGLRVVLVYILALLPPALFPDAMIFENIAQPRDQIIYMLVGLTIVTAWFYSYQLLIERYISEINDRTADLEKLSETGRVTIKSIGQAVLITNEKGETQRLNKHVLDMLKVDRKDLMHKSLSSVFQFCNEKYWAIKPEDLPLNRAMKSRRFAEDEVNFVLKDGVLITVIFSAAPLILKGKVIGAVITLRDISEEVERKRARAGFLQLTTHELRTPLSTVKWYLEYVLDSEHGRLNKEQREYILEAQQASHRMSALVDELLKISQLDVGLFSVEPTTIDIIKIIEEVVRDERISIEAKKIKVKVSSKGSLSGLKQDPNLIRILVLNFLTNAIKYSLNESTINIEVKTAHDLVISVKDKGIGVPEKQKNKMFTKQFRAENAIKLIPEGNGIGLHLSKRIVSVLDGDIGFESTEGKGSTFWISLPKVAVPRKDISEKEKSKAAIL